MKNKWIVGITLSGAAVVFFVLASWTDTSGLTPTVVKESKYAIGNEAVHMVGCLAMPEPVKPKVIFPPVVRTFVSLPCATEVPPPADAIEHRKRIGSKYDGF
jgi:hypothetical protein